MKQINIKNDDNIRKIVRERYGNIAKSSSSCCSGSGCQTGAQQAINIGQMIGYSKDELGSVPEDANLGLGCGNPVALASLKKGDIVLDMGSGAGFDCFLAAQKVGTEGRVIGVDMTPEMLEKARNNAKKSNYTNVEFRLGEIENLPVADNSVNVIISNCVINLSPDKAKVFKEAFRVLKPSGRFMVSDIVLLKDLPENIQHSIAAYIGCIAGAMKKDDYLKAIRSAGFTNVKVIDETVYPIEFLANESAVHEIQDYLKITQEQLEGMASSIVSIKVQGFKKG